MPDLIRQPNPQALADAAEALAGGRLVGLPTETVYGLAANAWDERAVRRIFEAKGRPATNPLIVHIASAERLADAAGELSEGQRELLRRLAPFWPGPLTLVLPKRDALPQEVTAGLDTVAVRVPDHPVALALLERCAFPLAAPSANRSNYVSPTTARHVAEGLSDAVAMILDGGPCRMGLESTILSLIEDPPRILRHGALPAERLAEALALPLATLVRQYTKPTGNGPLPDAPVGMSSPGQLPVHYSPQTPLRYRDSSAEPLGGRRVGLIAFQSSAPNEDSAYAAVERLSDSGDEETIARNLFAALRRLDALNLDLILVDRCERAGLGRAIMDRLDRAVRGASNAD
ncbi:MAG TPA: L-threonylcarbamoyladenylate synthase [Pirellulaceae bacterium]|jgi:L-threonylcarbamoyladenylate synthase|nr:L-threonylcarbamoyladenylate synthase [Pirellulaceae bacterium]